MEKNVIEVLCKNSKVFFANYTYKTNRYNMALLDFVGHNSIATTFHIGFAFVDTERKIATRGPPCMDD